MWPRVVEAVVGLWLLASPFALGAPTTDAIAVPLAGGLAVLALDLGARRVRLLHFLIVVVGLALIAWGWARFPRPGPAIAQSSIVAGLILGLMGVIPNEAGDPPPAWRPHVRGRS